MFVICVYTYTFTQFYVFFFFYVFTSSFCNKKLCVKIKTQFLQFIFNAKFSFWMVQFVSGLKWYIFIVCYFKEITWLLPFHQALVILLSVIV